MSEGMAPVKLLLDRSSPVILVQFLRPLGNGPWSPRLLRRNVRTRFSSGCQHSTPVNLHMKPAVPLSKIHEDFSIPFGSITDFWTSLKHWTSSSELKQLVLSSNRRRAPRPRAKWSVIGHFGGLIQLLPDDVNTTSRFKLHLHKIKFERTELETLDFQKINKINKRDIY